MSIDILPPNPSEYPTDPSWGPPHLPDSNNGHFVTRYREAGANLTDQEVDQESALQETTAAQTSEAPEDAPAQLKLEDVNKPGVRDMRQLIEARLERMGPAYVDVYDGMTKSAGVYTGLATGLTTTAEALQAIPNSHTVVGPSMLFGGLALAMCPAAIGVKPGIRSKVVATVPHTGGYGLELIKTGGDKRYPSEREGDFTSVMLPHVDKNGQPAETLPPAEVKRLVEAMHDGGVDTVVLPQTAAREAYPQLTTVIDGAQPLHQILATVKPGVPLKAKRAEQSDELFCVLEGPDIETAKTVLHEQRVVPFPAERAATLEKLVTQLSARLPAIRENAQPEAALLPATSEETQAMADRLRTYAQRQLVATTGDKAGWLKDRVENVRERLDYYALPVRSDDRYNPSVSIHMARNASGEPPEQAALQAYRPSGEQLKVLLAQESLSAADVTPALAELFAGLKELDAYWQKPEYEQGDVTDTRPVMAEVAFVKPGLRVDYDSWQPQRFRRRMTQFIGGAVLFGTVMGGVVSAIASGQEAHSGQGDSAVAGIGTATPPSAPSWRIEGHNGMDVSGYYKTASYTTLDLSAGGWLPPSNRSYTPFDGNAVRIDKTKPYETMTSFWESDNDDEQAGQALNSQASLTLPVKHNTILTDMQVTAPDGQPLPYSLLMAGDDGSVGMKVDTTGRPDGERERITYDLVEAKHTGSSISSMRIVGLKDQDMHVHDKNVTEALVQTVSTTFAYDNTGKINEIVKAAQSPEDLKQRTLGAQIANCNLAATVVAIEHSETRPMEPLAYTTGYLVEPGERYLYEKHAWLTDKDNHVVDATPRSTHGRSLQEAGLPDKSQAELDAAWAKLETQPAPSSNAPLTGVLAGLTGLGLAGSLGRRAQYAVRSARYKRAERGRQLNEAQAERVVSHALYGGATPAPELHQVEERLPATISAATAGHFTDIIRDTKATAPYLNRRQQRGLRRFARLRRLER